jgi:hypothetical protein
MKPTITCLEVFELYKIKYPNYTGNFRQFSKAIDDRYGSYTEYCLNKGYCINNTNWNEGLAKKVATKIGSMEEVENHSSSLANFLRRGQ